MKLGYVIGLATLLLLGIALGYGLGSSFPTHTVEVTKLITSIKTDIKTFTLPTTVTITVVKTVSRTEFITFTSTTTSTSTITERKVIIPQGNQLVIAWMLSTCDKSEWSVLERFSRQIDIVSPDWYYLTEDLSVGKYDKRCAEDREFIEFLNSLGVKLMPMLVSANSELVRKLVTDPNAIDSLSAELVYLAKKYNYYGYNIDFEVSIPEYSTEFASFIDRLAKKLHSNGLILTVDVPAKRMEWPSSYTATYDYAKLGKTEVDAVIIMAYDFYEWVSGPKPVAPIWWVEDCVRYALQYIPPEKLILGIPNYGKTWSVDGTFRGWLLYPDWLALIEKSGKNYTIDKELMEKVLELNNEVAYFVDGEMGYYRAFIAVKYELKGIAVWRLDKGDPNAWSFYARALGK
ncbi:MAG: hypothetical protein B7O98_00485 [Zestosphaera tikiterensis]|uniref:GH18 domain-containing protein n=1 Tax=Zestosphaera tikiterensis TaxID=1973259 RepID=A0A2R7Y8Q1_9CREN|nr:MAG: hypothetical protein B7O98_00485 [Zestosphaera tikiterensis]